MKVNGKYLKLESKMMLKEFLETKGYKIQQIAVEINQKIVSKVNFENIILNDEDVIEIVSFVGGG